MDISQQLLAFSRKYPLMRTEDYIKLLFQGQFFGGHFMLNAEDALHRLKAEIAQCAWSKVDEQEKPSDDFLNMSRVNLRPFAKSGKSEEVLNELFVVSNKKNHGSKEQMEHQLATFLKLVEQKKIDLPFFSVRRAINKYIDMDFPILRHSPTYRLNYRPSYRVVRRDFWFLFDAIEAIMFLLATNLTVLVAIDGNSCAGKSYFGKRLGEFFDANVVCVDDFFLPKSMRTPQTEAQVGGNIDWQKLQTVLRQAKNGDSFDFSKYDCINDSFENKHYDACRLTIVEGSFALSERIANAFDYAICLSVSKPQQKKRILLRESADMQKQFFEKWIPNEDRHLSALNTDGISTLKINTDGYDFSF